MMDLLIGRGPVVAPSTTDQEVPVSNPTLAKHELH